MIGQLDLIQRRGVAQLAHGSGDHADSQQRGPFGIVLVRPRALLADVYLLIQVRVHVGARDGTAKGLFMQRWRARRDHDAIQILLKDVRGDGLLARIRTAKGIHLCSNDSGNQAHGGRAPLHIDNIGDVPAAAADVHSDSWLRGQIKVLLPSLLQLQPHGGMLLHVGIVALQQSLFQLRISTFQI